MPLELVTVTTQDGVDLDGACYRPADTHAPVGILLVHGLTWNFYRGPCRWLAPALAQRSVCLSLNMRDHDLPDPVDFERSHFDIRAGLDHLESAGCRDLVLLAHGFGCNKVVCYSAQSGDARPFRYVLTTLGSVKSYRPAIWDQVLASAAAMRGEALVVQGAVDTLIEPLPRADEFVAAATEAEVDVLLLERGDHYFAGTETELTASIGGWLDKDRRGAAKP